MNFKILAPLLVFVIGLTAYAENKDKENITEETRSLRATLQKAIDTEISANPNSDTKKKEFNSFKNALKKTTNKKECEEVVKTYDQRAQRHDIKDIIKDIEEMYGKGVTKIFFIVRRLENVGFGVCGEQGWVK